MMTLEEEFPQYNWAEIDEKTRKDVEKLLALSKMLSKEEQDALGEYMEEERRRKTLLYG